MKLSETTIEQLITLKNAKDFLAEADGDRSELTPELLEALYNRALNDKVDLLTYKNYPSACGCMGPENGEPFCNCTMNYMLERFKYDVALLVKERNQTNEEQQ